MALYDEMKYLVHKAIHSQYAVRLLDAIFGKPTFRSIDMAQQLNREFNIHEKTTLYQVAIKLYYLLDCDLVLRRQGALH